MTTRIFQNKPLAVGAEIQLTEAAAHHLLNVLRIKRDAPVIIFNGKGGEFSGAISLIQKKNIWVKLTEFSSREAESALNIYLAQGISRGEKMDYTLQKAVELGVKKIIPLLTERCNVKLDPERLEKKWQHWQGIIESACEQSGRNILPILAKPQKLSVWLTNFSPARHHFILAPNASHGLKKHTLAKNEDICILVGPEGGFSETEMQLAEQQKFQRLQLGPRILRTETAALVALAALQTLIGDFS